MRATAPSLVGVSVSLLLPVLCALPASDSGAAAQDIKPSKAATELAVRLLAADSAGDRQRLLVANPDLITIDLSRALITEANRLLAAGELGRALPAYELGRQIADRIGDRANAAGMLLGIGTVHGQQGNYAEAARYMRESLAMAEALDDRRRTGLALNNLGIVHRREGEYEQAIEVYQRSLKLAEAEGQIASVARVLNNIGIVQMDKGNYREALRYYRESLRLKEAAGQTADIPNTLHNIGAVHEFQGNPDLALEYYRRALNLSEQLGQRLGIARVLMAIGNLQTAQRRYDAAAGAYRQALTLAEDAGGRYELAMALRRLGVVSRRLGRYPEAMEHFRRSLALREAMGDRPGIVETLIGVAQVAHAQRDLPTALEAIERASRLAAETGNRDLFWRARLVAGETHQALGRLDPARQAFGEAIETVEDLRGTVAGGQEEHERFLESRLTPYHRLAALLITEGRTREALGVAERAKARVLLDVLRAGRADVRVLTPEDRERERALQQQITSLSSALWAATRKASTDPGVEPLRARLASARLAHAEFRAALYQAHPTLKHERGDTWTGSLDDVAPILDDGQTTILEFMTTDEATYLFIVGRTQAMKQDDEASAGLRLTCVTLPITAEDLSRRTETFRRQLATRDLAFQKAARELYTLLLSPAASELREKTHLIVVPDGALWDLPFQALQTSGGRYLIEDAAISYAPSIGALREIRARRAGRSRAGPPRLLAVGDPVLRREGPAEAAERKEASFQPLPDAARQVRKLAQLYGTTRSRVLIGPTATQERLMSAGMDWTILHFATHAIVDNASPMYSFLLLAEDGKAGATGDGRLEAWEVMALKVQPDVAILAACETARGRVGGGEGVVGLSWAFFLAGAGRTVVSLWEVGAGSTTELMLAFHGRLRARLLRTPERAGVAASLRAAALTLLRDPRYSHPFYWAPFIVVGDGS